MFNSNTIRINMYNVFIIKLSSFKYTNKRMRFFYVLQDLVMKSLLDFLPKGVNKAKMTGGSLNEAYVHKMVKIYTDSDRWSLISLSNARGRNVELKFADTMRRQFEFSVDSFQVSYMILSVDMTFCELLLHRFKYNNITKFPFNLQNNDTKMKLQSVIVSLDTGFKKN